MACLCSSSSGWANALSEPARTESKQAATNKGDKIAARRNFRVNKHQLTLPPTPSPPSRLYGVDVVLCKMRRTQNQLLIRTLKQRLFDLSLKSKSTPINQPETGKHSRNNRVDGWIIFIRDLPRRQSFVIGVAGPFRWPFFEKTNQVAIKAI